MLTCFNPSIPEEEMDAYILDGHYILQAYATSHWLDHVKEGIRGDTGSQDLMTLIQKITLFLAKRQNQDFDWKALREEGVLELKPFEKHQKRLYQELCYINSSLTTELSESLKVSKKKSEHRQFHFSSHAPPGNVVQHNCWVQKPETPEIPKHWDFVDYEFTPFILPIPFFEISP